MANITDGSAVRFSNEQIRPACDKIMQFYWFCKELKVQFTAQGLGSLFPNDISVIVDGSPADGRTSITGADVNVALANMTTIINLMEAGSNILLNQFGKIAVNSGA